MNHDYSPAPMPRRGRDDFDRDGHPIDSGGDFFAHGGNERSHYTQSGLSLRDWYAGEAMKVILRNETVDISRISPNMVAINAFALADAMIQARRVPAETA